MLEYRFKNKFGFEAERLKVCSAAKRMFAVFNPDFQYLIYYNEIKPYQGIDNKTPSQINESSERVRGMILLSKESDC